jgi:hypothetical protein
METAWWLMEPGGRRLGLDVGVLGMEVSRHETSFMLADTW